MKTVISASRRTDIPAFYLDWLVSKIKDGSVEVENTFYRGNFRFVDLTPAAVEWIVFWSRNYGPFLSHHDFFAPYRLFFHFTIVTHDSRLEKSGPSQQTVIKQLERLVKIYGSEVIIWRYDPLFFWQNRSVVETNFNKSNLDYLARLISGLGVRRCYFSFATLYQKFLHRLKTKYPEWQTNGEIISLEKIRALGILKEITAKYNIQLFSCCNDLILDDQIIKGHCISGPLLNKLRGKKTVSNASHASRQDCGCTKSVDIGDYLKHPCHYGCIYCYANPVWKTKHQDI